MVSWDHIEFSDRAGRDMRAMDQAKGGLDLFALSAAELNILVVGDLIFDEYRYCSPVGTTTKAPAISAIERGAETMLGGAAAVARHCANFGSNVDLLTRLSHVDLPDFYRLLSEDRAGGKVNPIIEECDTSPRKVRYISAGYPNTLNKQSDSVGKGGLGQKLFEVAYLPIASNDEAGRERRTIDLEVYDLVIVMDFGHGFMTKSYWNEIRERSKFVALNVQTNSTNYGFNLVTKYTGADLVCLDELEARLACTNRDCGFDELLTALRRVVVADHICVTRGSEGLVLVDEFNKTIEFPAIADRVIDPVGAGDAVLAFLSMGVVCGLPMPVTGKIGAAAGAAACQIVGNRDSISRQELESFLLDR